MPTAGFKDNTPCTRGQYAFHKTWALLFNTSRSTIYSVVVNNSRKVLTLSIPPQPGNLIVHYSGWILVAIHRAVSTLLHGRILACRAGGKFLLVRFKMDSSMSQDRWSGSKTCF